MKKNAPAPATHNKIDIPSLELSAAAKLSSGNYKEAIEHYKTLLKTADKPDWRHALAQCYLQRALSFAAKGMVKEAAVLWESYSQNSGNGCEYWDYYLAWLLQSNDLAKAKKNLQQLSAQQLDEQYPNLACLLGLLMLTHKPEIEAVLPKDSLLIKHLALAKGILAAYQSGQQELVNSQLQQLPFRSAFKDLRTLLKAAMSLDDKVQAQALLAKISIESPYRSMADSLLACTHEGSQLVKNLQGLSHKQVQLVGVAKHFNKQQLELLDVLVKQRERLSDKLKFNLALQYSGQFGDTLVARYCYSALTTTYPTGQRDFSKQFGLLDEFEESRLKALAFERKDELHDALYYWRRCVALLQAQKPKDNLKIALLMRHIAQKEYPMAQAIVWLQDSLEYDPTDRDSYLKILAYYDSAPQQTENVKQWLDACLAQFPQDIEVLQVAVKNAIRRQAFAEAEQYAQAILKTDPVNIMAKQTLLISRLGQFRQLVKSKQTKQLDKVKADLQDLATSKLDQRWVELLLALADFAQAKTDKQLVGVRVAEIIQQLYPSLLSAHLCALMEATLMGLPLAAIQKLLPPLAKDSVLSAQELKQLLDLVMQFQRQVDTQPFVTKLLDKIKAPIKYTLVNHRFDEELTLAFCQTMVAIEHYDLLRTCVKHVSYEWESPIWPYFRVYSAVNGDASRCSPINIMTLQINLNHALDEDDHRTATVIEAFLNKTKNDQERTLAGAVDGFDDDEDGNPLALFNDLPDELYEKMDKHADERLRKTGPDRLITALIKQYFPKDDGTIMQTVLKNVLACHALNMLKSAEELGIYLNVTPADIIACIQNERAAPSW